MKYQNLSSAQTIIFCVADRIKTARQNKRITLERLSKDLKISCKQLQNYEKAKCELTVVRLCEISEILDIEPSFFLQGLGKSKATISTGDLKLINKFHKIKNQQTKQALIKLLNDL